MGKIYNYISKGFHALAGASLVSVLALSLMTSPAQGQLNSNVKTNILDNNVNKVAGSTYNQNQDLLGVISNYIKFFLGILGIVAMALVIWAGFKWMTAQGDGDKVTEAKTIMINAVLGLVVISLAYAGTAFVFNTIISAGNP